MHSRGEVQLSVDASGVFDPYEPPVFAGFGQPAPPPKKGPFHALTKLQTQQLFMRHSFEVTWDRLRHLGIHSLRYLDPGGPSDPRYLGRVHALPRRCGWW